MLGRIDRASRLPVLYSRWMKPVTDPSVAAWVTRAIGSFGQGVGWVVPRGFGAYARVLHPAGRREGDDWTTVRWNEVATANGVVMQPASRFADLVPEGSFDRAGNALRQQPGLWESPPREGELPSDIAVALASVLMKHTEMPELCYFGYWEGWGDPVILTAPSGGINEPPDRLLAGYEGTPRSTRDQTSAFEIPGRRFFLFEGTIDEVETKWTEPFGALASMWWPADRTWCVATEIDLTSTFVGGSEACIAEVLSHPDLEALPASVDQRLA
jgi:hypothetical protein